MARTNKPTARIHKRLPLPPPPQRSSLALWPDLDALDDDLAWAMFLLTRRMRAMADTAPPGLGRWARGLEVRAAAAGAPEIGADLRLLVSATGAPNENQRPLAAASFRLAEWSDRRGIPELAVQFASAAVALDPTNPEQAFVSARMLRRLDRLAEAEILYGRAIWLARSVKRWEIYVRAHLGVGHIHQERGQRDSAAAHFAPAANAAWNLSGEKWLAGMTQHDLLVLHTIEGRLDDAFRHALKTHDCMPMHSERVPAFVHDASLLLTRMRAYELAIPLLCDVVQKTTTVGDRTLAWSTMARAAGGLGSVEQFRGAEHSILATRDDFTPQAAAVYANVAMGAHLLGFFSDAERYAVRSVSIASTRGEAGIAEDARRTLESVRCGTIIAHPAIDDPPPHLRTLAHDLETRLAVWRGPTWKRKRQSGAADLGEV